MRQMFYTEILITIIVASFTIASTNYIAACQELKNRFKKDSEELSEGMSKNELRCKEKGKFTKIHFHETYYVAEYNYLIVKRQF